MGWNTAALLAQCAPAAVEAIFPESSTVVAERLGFESASASSLAPDMALGTYQRWTIVWDPNAQFVMDEQILAQLSSGGRALACVVNSVVTVYGFCYYVDRQPQRRVIQVNYQNVEAETYGKMLAEEDGLGSAYSEDIMFEIVRRLTGLDLTQDLWSVPFTRIKVTP